MSYYADSEFADDPNTPWYKVLDLITGKSKVLDIGCSSGNFGEVIINRKGAIVDGIELDKKDVEIAKKKLRKVLNLNVETDELNKLDKDYDFIYFGDVIEHLVYPSKALKKVKKNLGENGAVIFSIPNMAHISVRLMLLAGKFEYGNTGLLDKTHLHYYDKTEIERVFSDAGYSIRRLDWVSRDIPKELLERELKKIGLTANETFFKLARSLDAGAYQYIGLAVPISGKVNPEDRPKVSPEIDMFEKHLADIRKSYEEDVARINKQTQQAHSVNAELLNERINEYEKSLSWKVTKPLRSVSKVVRKRGEK
jgi:2-polyprenyl-3-methyl-5-hydroxy-6-metoxy-1,4-benzoquinol methylase